MSNYTDAVVAIEAATLTGNEYRTARRLLDLAAVNNGHLHLDPVDAYRLCAVTDWGAVRRQLRKLKECGVIQFHSNARAYIRFVAYIENAHGVTGIQHPRAGIQQPTGEPGADVATEIQHTVTEIQQRVDSAVIRAGYPIQDLTTGRKDIPPSLPSEPVAPEPETPDAGRIVGLLTDPEVGLLPATAATFTALPLEEVTRQVFRWLADKASGKVRGSGALAKRLANPEAWPATITAQDRASPLWARHLTGSELDENTEAARRRKYDLYAYQEQTP
jgi:hypothetical protein